MSRGLHWLALAAMLWLVMVASGLALRAPLPIDETRYLAVAWEMWARGDFLVPFRNGEPYPHKPPLLFWLIQLGWLVLGVNETWGRLVAPLFGLGAAFLTFDLARRLWPDRPDTRGFAVVLLMATALFALFTTLTFVDTLVAFFALLGWIGLVVARTRERRGWSLVALAIGFGVLAKGPVILLHVLPAALLAPWWMESPPGPWRRWFAGLGLASAGGAAIALAWAIPAAIAGGNGFAHAIFLSQSTGRMVESFAHRRIFWWYVPAGLLALGPVLWWLAPWRLARVTRGVWREPGVRLCLAAAVPTFLAFSLVSGKQPHYLLPEVPLFAIMVARLLDQDAFVDRVVDRLLPALALLATGFAIALSPIALDRIIAGRPGLGSSIGFGQVAGGAALMISAGWILVSRARPVARRVAQFGIAVAAVVALGHASFTPLAPAYDSARPAAAIAAAARAGPVAMIGDYESEFHFTGRLVKPIVELLDADPVAWAEANPQGAVIATYARRVRLPSHWPQPLYFGAWRGRVLALWPSATVIEVGSELFSDPPRDAR